MGYGDKNNRSSFYFLFLANNISFSFSPFVCLHLFKEQIKGRYDSTSNPIECSRQ